MWDLLIRVLFQGNSELHLCTLFYSAKGRTGMGRGSFCAIAGSFLVSKGFIFFVALYYDSGRQRQVQAHHRAGSHSEKRTLSIQKRAIAACMQPHALLLFPFPRIIAVLWKSQAQHGDKNALATASFLTFHSKKHVCLFYTKYTTCL